MLGRLFALLAVVAALAVAGFAGDAVAPSSAGAAPPIQYNVDPGGGQITSFIYIARVYIYYGGYWHWLNCEYIVYTDGSVIQNRCW
jgi:hypothetical protein